VAEPAYLGSLFCCFAAEILSGSAQGLFCIMTYYRPTPQRTRHTNLRILQEQMAHSGSCVATIISHYVNIVFGLFWLGRSGLDEQRSAGVGSSCRRRARNGPAAAGSRLKTVDFFLQLKSSFEKKIGIFKMRSLNNMRALEKV